MDRLFGLFECPAPNDAQLLSAYKTFDSNNNQDHHMTNNSNIQFNQFKKESTSRIQLTEQKCPIMKDTVWSKVS